MMRTRRKKSLYALFVILVGLSLSAQNVSVVNDIADDALRRGQLWGDLPLTSSFCIRPLHGSAVKSHNPYESLQNWDTLFPSRDSSSFHLSKSWLNGNVRVDALPLYSRIQYNGHHPYGWQDGPMIPNKGLQTYFNAGVFAKFYFLEAQFSPEWVYAQNEPETWNPPVRVYQGDFPDRFGTGPYVRKFGGQSFIRGYAGPFVFSYGTENLAWGPAQDVNLLMSSNAPGMPHTAMGTRKPIQTRIGSIEAQVFIGNLAYSGFGYEKGPSPWGSELSDVYRDTTRDGLSRVFSGIVAVYSPKWLPGLSVGAIRSIWQEGATDTTFNAWQLIPALVRNPFGTGAYAFQTGPMDQMAAVFFRYVMPESHVEIWGEFARDDAAADLEDLITSPGHSRGYQWGFRKLIPLSGKQEYLDAYLNVVQCEAAKELFIRTQYGFATFYDSDYSNFGQNLGAGIGTGSNMLKTSLSYVKGAKKYGIQIEQVAHNNDNIYTGRTPWLATWYGYDFTKKYIDWGISALYQERQGNLLYNIRLMGMQTYNWNNWYHPTIGWDPNISTFRALGANYKSLNVFIGIMYFL